MLIFLPILSCCLLAILLPPSVVGHGSMVKPFSWIDTAGNVGMKPYSSCTAGSQIHVSPNPNQNMACLWFNNFTFIHGQPTLDPAMSTFTQQLPPGPYKPNISKNPWRSPGSAPIHSPCGVAGGNPNGCPSGSSQGIGEYCPGSGWSYGPLAQDFYVHPGFPDVITTEWKTGSIVDAAWGMVANHGGGYSYRLCKVPVEGMADLTEECFQQNHLEFYGNMQWVQYGDDVNTRIGFQAHRTKEGTFPKGSQWTRNPIPNCLCSDDPGPNLDYGLWDVNCTYGTQFPPPAPGLMGPSHNPPPHTDPNFGFSIVDQLIVPIDITPGEYVLSFRWDCEQTSQVWNQCANIRIIQ